MVVLKVLGSESSGNCYILNTGSEILIIEAGIRIADVKKHIGFDIGMVSGCVISHSHGDHAKYAKDFLNTGIDVYASQQTIDEAKLHHHRAHAVKELFHVGEFTIVPFPVPHGVFNYGYLINHKGCGKLLFVTDAHYIPAKFNGLNHILIEANYEDAILTNDRAVGKHMSLDTTVNFLKSNSMAKVYNIVLLHLSSGNSDSKMFISKIKEAAPNSKVWVADKEVEISLNIYPF